MTGQSLKRNYSRERKLAGVRLNVKELAFTFTAGLDFHLASFLRKELQFLRGITRCGATLWHRGEE